MGEVFLAEARGVARRCVIKTIRGDLTGDKEFVNRFADEAKIMVRISHDNIIRVFDAGRVRDDYYIAMEWVYGHDLGDVLDRAYERGTPLPVPLGLFITSEVMAGLEHTHQLTDEDGRHMRLVHRDISPQNVLIGFDGSIKLIDFGLARTQLLPARTQGALAIGKYGYMSPEQARHGEIDGRADIYSAGVMLFEVFTGDRLVDEQDQATLWQRVLDPKHRAPSSVISSLPKAIDDLILKAVAVAPEDRFQSAAEMKRAADALRDEQSTREALVRYVKGLYPREDPKPPPMVPAQLETDDDEKSMIIATSREGAMSVFGRGELPIEWTQEHISLSKPPPDSAAPRTPSGIAPTEISTTSETMHDSTALETRTDIAARPTAVADGPTEDDTKTIAGHRPDFLHDAGDEEQTVMMDAPHREDEAPTRIARPADIPAEPARADDDDPATSETQLPDPPAAATAAPPSPPWLWIAIAALSLLGISLVAFLVTS